MAALPRRLARDRVPRAQTPGVRARQATGRRLRCPPGSPAIFRASPSRARPIRDTSDTRGRVRRPHHYANAGMPRAQDARYRGTTRPRRTHMIALLSGQTCHCNAARTSRPTFVKGSHDRWEHRGELGGEHLEHHRQRTAKAGLLPAPRVRGAFEGPPSGQFKPLAPFGRTVVVVVRLRSEPTRVDTRHVRRPELEHGVPLAVERAAA